MPDVEIVVDGKTYALNCGEERTFKSGSRGFWVNGKTKIDGKQYNLSFGMVEIGSKPSE